MSTIKSRCLPVKRLYGTEKSLLDHDRNQYRLVASDLQKT